MYCYSRFISEINGSLTSLADEITDLNLALSGYSNGTYYFIVVAHNIYRDTLSNCIQVNVERITPTLAIPEYNITIAFLCMLGINFLLIKSKLKGVLPSKS